MSELATSERRMLRTALTNAGKRYIASRCELIFWDYLVEQRRAQCVERTTGLCTFALTDEGVSWARKVLA